MFTNQSALAVEMCETPVLIIGGLLKKLETVGIGFDIHLHSDAAIDTCTSIINANAFDQISRDITILSIIELERLIADCSERIQYLKEDIEDIRFGEFAFKNVRTALHALFGIKQRPDANFKPDTTFSLHKDMAMTSLLQKIVTGELARKKSSDAA